jgi:uncharacterized protein YajQ (UPF0234 family)
VNTKLSHLHSECPEALPLRERCAPAPVRATWIQIHDARRTTISFPPMATNPSFDISTGVDIQEVDNAVNQALKEIAARYDFKGTHCTVELDREKATIALLADDEFRMEALLDVVRGRLIKRGVPVKNTKVGDPVVGTMGSVRRVLTLTQGIPSDIAKKIQRAIKDSGFKKVQASIQGDELRVTSPSRDELQAVMAFLRGQDFEVDLQFGNYRG